LQKLKIGLCIVAGVGSLVCSTSSSSFGSALTSSELPYFQTFFSPLPDRYSRIHIVQPGDSLYALSEKYGVTPDLIRRMNRVRSNNLLAGQRLKIPTQKVSLFIDKSDNALLLKVGPESLKRYIVSTGRNNSTPVGEFRITTKLEHPTWYKEGEVIPPFTEANHLGTRWIGISLKGYGIHGTVEPHLLGQQVSHGCIRMKNEEVEELFRWVPTGTVVKVVD
jgi:lipoprotein-anchoring transpeptidase ErfK/SrfK